ncbi:Hypothetical protein CAP_5107 [Chondromyces apiculatus DSM 436]|uniref:Uncharacterized protein n=1 Tax=Chondromyces apiculatus DSM 436 TaxID=1192034 RepID=A0A017T3L6_9BACT|nr:Hypothetical protein CAP_5107 [Chondromyces apiculatus DSM 436]
MIENKNGRGSASVSSMNGPVTVYESQFGSKFNGALSLAISDGDTTATAKLELEYQRLSGYSFHFNGSGNQIYATVTANGGLFKASRMEIYAKAKVLRIY